MRSREVSPTSIFHVTSGTHAQKEVAALSPFNANQPRLSPDIVDPLVALIMREENGYLHNEQNVATYLRCIDLSSRAAISTWLCSIAKNDIFGAISWEVAEITIDLFDLYLSTNASVGKAITEDTIELTAISALRIATKLYSRQFIHIQTFRHICNEKYAISDIEEMENKILSSLSWKVNPPLAVDFAAQFLSLIPTKALRVRLAKHCDVALKVAAICDPFFIGTPRSILAFCSILVAAEDTDTMDSIDVAGVFLSFLPSNFDRLDPNDQLILSFCQRLRDIKNSSQS